MANDKDRGWIRLHRKFLEWEWYGDHVVKAVFIHLLLSANHHPIKWQGQAINRGEVLTGRKKLASVLGFSEMQIRSAIKKLKSTNEIAIRITNRFSLIKLNNYDVYQQNNQQDNQQITNKQPTDNQQITTNNKNKNEKNDKNEKNVLIDSGETSSPAQTARDFFKLVDEKNDRYAQFCLTVNLSKNVNIEIVRRELDKFANYWCEKNKSGTKQRWELEKTFEVERRLVTWFSRIRDFQQKNFKEMPKKIVFTS